MTIPCKNPVDSSFRLKRLFAFVLVSLALVLIGAPAFAEDGKASSVPAQKAAKPIPPSANAATHAVVQRAGEEQQSAPEPQAPGPQSRESQLPKPDPSWEHARADERVQASDEESAERIAVSFTAAEPGIVFYSWVGPGLVQDNSETVMLDGQVYQKVCEAPCTASLRQGHNRFALSYHGADPVIVPKEVTLYQPTTFHAEYQSHGVERLFGGIILTGGAVGGVALIMTAPDCKKESNDLSKPLSCSYAQKWIGLALGVILGGSGALLLLKTDVADVSIAPGVASPASRNGGGAYELRGLSLSGRF